MIEREEIYQKQITEKEFNKYTIKIIQKIDSIIILINQNKLLFQSKFNLNYLQSFKLLLPNLTVHEMVKFIINLIDQKKVRIEENKIKLKFVLISLLPNYPNVKLILNKKNELMNEINNLKDENFNLETKINKLDEKIELIGNKDKKEENKVINNEINILKNKIELIEKDNKFIIESFISNISELNDKFNFLQNNKKDIENRIQLLV